MCILFLGSRMHKYLNHNVDDRPTVSLPTAASVLLLISPGCLQWNGLYLGAEPLYSRGIAAALRLSDRRAQLLCSGRRDRPAPHTQSQCTKLARAVATASLHCDCTTVHLFAPLPSVGTCCPCLQYAYDRIMEGEGRDRTSLKLNPNQEALWKVGAPCSTETKWLTSELVETASHSGCVGGKVNGGSVACVPGRSWNWVALAAPAQWPYMPAQPLASSHLPPAHLLLGCPQYLVARTTKRIVVVLMHGGGLDSECSRLALCDSVHGSCLASMIRQMVHPLAPACLSFLRPPPHTSNAPAQSAT